MHTPWLGVGVCIWLQLLANHVPCLRMTFVAPGVANLHDWQLENMWKCGYITTMIWPLWRSCHIHERNTSQSPRQVGCGAFPPWSSQTCFNQLVHTGASPAGIYRASPWEHTDVWVQQRMMPPFGPWEVGWLGAQMSGYGKDWRIEHVQQGKSQGWLCSGFTYIKGKEPDSGRQVSQCSNSNEESRLKYVL